MVVKYAFKSNTLPHSHSSSGDGNHSNPLPYGIYMTPQDVIAAINNNHFSDIELNAALNHYFRRISIRWYIEDVAMVQPELSPDECYQVLLNADRQHDAAIGINWDVLRFTNK